MTSPLDPRGTAAIDMLGRTGARGIQIRWSDDEEPTVWLAVATYGQGNDERHETAAALEPVTALLRLCELLIDGAECQHCHRLTSFVPDMDTSLLDEISCVYAWDPELETFRRGCEGST